MVDFYESQNVTWIEAYLRHDEQTPSKIIFVSLSALNIILGTPVILAIISYERYGCDPQKRGLTNQLASQMLAINLLAHVIMEPIYVWHMLFLRKEKVFCWFWIYCIALFMKFFFGILAGFQYTLVRHLSIVVLHRVLPICDDFFGMFLGITNLIVGMFLSVISCYSIGILRIQARFPGLFGHTLDVGSSTKLYLLLDMIPPALVFLIYTTWKIIKTKRSAKRSDERQSIRSRSGSSSLNVVSKNGEILSQRMFLILNGVIATITILSIILNGSLDGLEVNSIIPRLAAEYSLIFLNFTSIPTLMVIGNAKLRQYIAHLFNLC